MTYALLKVKLIRLYFNRQIPFFFLLGVASGIPFLLTLSTLAFWLTESGVTPTIIGLFTLATLPYSIKFLWAPFLDRFALSFSGNRHKNFKILGIAAQVGLVISTFLLGALNPVDHLLALAFAAFLLSFFAATLDIIIDTLRVELVTLQRNGAIAAIESIGFRFGMFISGAGALYLASLYDWKTAYWIMGGVELLGIPALWFIPTENRAIIIKPFTSFYHMLKESFATLYKETPFVYLVLFVFTFKIADTILSAMSAPFLHDLGFNKIEYADITKAFGIPFMIIGGLVSGYLIHQMGCLLIVAVSLFLQAVSCLLFLIQSWVGHDISILMVTIGVESFASGMAATAFIAMVSMFCKTPFSAGHFTFLYAIGSLSRVIVSSVSGVAASLFGWSFLFFITALITIPSFYCLIQLKRLSTIQETDLIKKVTNNDIN